MEIEAEIEVDETTGLVKRSAPPPYPIGPATFAALLDGPLKRFPERVALIDNERQWTFAELDRSVDQAAAALTSLGVGPGDRVAWSLANCAEVPIGFLATQRLAAVWLGINMKSRSARKISPSQRLASMPVDHRERYDRRVQQHVVQRVCNQRVRIQRCGLNSRPHRRSTPKYRPPCARPRLPTLRAQPGAPKGAVHSQHNLLWPGLITLSTHPPKPTDRQGTPLAHTILNMLILGVVSAWTRGTTGVVLHRGDPEGFCAEVTRHRLTRTTLVPAQLHDLVHHCGVNPEDLASLESILVGGAVTPANTRRALRREVQYPCPNGLRPF